ncbi:3-dehydroquinate synthase [Bacteroidota bacterium]
MKTIELNTGAKTSRIHIGESIDKLSNYLPDNSIIITDTNVFKLYGKRFPDIPVVIIEPGEQSKSFSTIENISTELLNLNADRNTFLIGFGGGVVTDITGFVASIYNRGLQFGYVSTTLLGQVDASIGGKTGINLERYKNIIGTINQPEFIISDISTLKSLPKNELLNGTAELIKTALIGDRELYDNIETNYKNILNLDSDTLKFTIFHAAKIKAGIVQKDENELSIRRLLNFGHTFGHAIESVSGVSHGEAVSIGMIIALEISKIKLGLDSPLIDRIKTLLSNIGLPVEININKEKVLAALIKDKKRYGESVKFVLLKDISEPIIKDIEIKELVKLYYDMSKC